jgi:preprotein translocase subunit SecA
MSRLEVAGAWPWGAARRHEAYTGAYPERRDRRPGAQGRLAFRLAGPLARRVRASRVRPGALIRAVEEAGAGVQELDAQGLREAASALRGPLRQHGFRDDLVARCFALVREAARRALGERHYDVQLVGGRVLLAGLVAEMETGEGKTLTATLAASAAALAGMPVHVVTVNDYLAARDAEWMGPVYAALGLRVGAVVQGLDALARRAAYRCDVTYCTNKELAFDYLRDRLVLGQRSSRARLQLGRLSDPRAPARQLVLRGLHFAIVDEADSVLVDEARTPLVLSRRGRSSAERRVYEQALALAARLEPAAHFTVDARQQTVELCEQGRLRLEELARPLAGPWRARLRREELVRQALCARHLFQRDAHYLVQDDGRVVIVDEFTGRRMPDRAFEQGLHQLLEVKEGVALSRRSEALARISYQRFFRRYLHLAGMTGTAREARSELWNVYRLAVRRIPTHRPLRRRALPPRACASADARWGAVVARVAELHRAGRPVLIGTRSVLASERLRGLLAAAGLPHSVLSARHDAAEAAIVARAGEPGRITVATNLAGRGTDIELAPGVAERGGLHVIATEHHEARRIDRQLFGRCGRQGDPGTFEVIASLDDELLLRHAGVWRRAARLAAGRGGALPSWLARLAFRRAQRCAERLHTRTRMDLLRLDEHLETALAFSGTQE